MWCPAGAQKGDSKGVELLGRGCEGSSRLCLRAPVRGSHGSSGCGQDRSRGECTPTPGLLSPGARLLLGVQGGGAPDPSHSTWRSGVGVGSKRLELFLPGGRLHADSAASPYPPAGSCPKSKSSRENVFGSVLINAPYATVQDGPRPNGRHPSLF